MPSAGSLASNTKDKMDFEGVKDGVKTGSLLVIDVRNPDEIANHGKIPTSINIPREKAVFLKIIQMLLNQAFFCVLGEGPMKSHNREKPWFSKHYPEFFKKWPSMFKTNPIFVK